MKKKNKKKNCNFKFNIYRNNWMYSLIDIIQDIDINERWNN